MFLVTGFPSRKKAARRRPAHPIVLLVQYFPKVGSDLRIGFFFGVSLSVENFAG
jgi:hypothetical protein